MILSRCRQAADALWPTALLWVGLVAFAVWRNADWPDTYALWRLFIVSAFAAEYFLFKAAVLWVRWRGWDSLTATLIVTNGILAFAFFLQMAGFLWQAWAIRHEGTINYVAYLLIIGFILGILEFALLPIPDETEDHP